MGGTRSYLKWVFWAQVKAGVNFPAWRVFPPIGYWFLGRKPP